MRRQLGRSGLVCLLFLAHGSFASGGPAPADRDARLIPHEISTGPAAETAPATRAPEALCAATVLPTDGSTSGNARAPTARFRGSRAVYLITASELAASGLPSGVSPSAIGWRYSIAPGLAATGTLTVYLQNTDDTTNIKGTSFSAAIAGMTTVHNASATLPNTTAPFDITFAGGAPFTYTGGGLYVAFDWRYAVGTLSSTAVISCNTALAGGLASSQTAGTSPPPAPDTLATVNFRPETRFTVSIGTDVSVDYVITMGQLANGLVSPQVVRAVVTNRGDATTDIPVTLDISGADSFSDTKIVPALAACGGQATVSFAPFTPGVLGANTVTVSVPADDTPGNDSKSRNLENTVNRLSYKHAGTTPAGGVGVTGSTAEFVARFESTMPTQIDAVTVEFPTTIPGAAYKLSIREKDESGLPGTQLYVDAADRSVTAGTLTLRLPAPVSVGPGDFFVGVQQTGTTNIGLAFDRETPVRSGAFYVAPGAGPFTDFAINGNNFKLDLGITVGACLVPMSNDVQPASASICAGNALTFESGVTGGTGPATYQWTEDGVDLPGETGSTLDITKGSAGSFAYNVKIGDDGGCTSVLDPSDSTGTWVGGGGACDDGNPCTGPDTCAGPVCAGPDACDDASVCTDDLCDAQGGCSHPSIDCNDANPCTDDACDSITGCVHVPVAGSCDDGSACTAGDACSGGVCVPGTPTACTDGNDCTDDGCNPASGACVFTNNAAACDDGNACTVNDQCGGGACQPGVPTIPDEAAAVRATNKTTFTWTATPFATRYDAVRGKIAGLPAGPGGGDEICFPDLSAASLSDAAVPGSGQSYWYLVRGENACFAGTYGTRSNGAPRSTTTCP